MNPKPRMAFATASPSSGGGKMGGAPERSPLPSLRRLFSTDSGKDSEETVTATRRRPRGSSEGPRERAEAPERQTDQGTGRIESSSASQGYSRPSSQSTAEGGGLLQLLLQMLLGGGLSAKTLIIGAIIIIGLIIIVGPMLSSLGGGDVQNPSTSQPVQPVLFPTQAPAVLPTSTPTRVAVLPTATQRPAAGIATVAPAAAATVAPAAVSKGQKWLVMLYQDADDKTLEGDIFYDFNEAERVGSTDRVQIVAQLDRYRGGFDGDGDWTGARRYLVTKDSNLDRIGSRAVADLGEVNMGDPATLVSFATWAMKTYPADKYVLILSDHGMGWPGGFSDGDSGKAARDTSIPLVRAIGNFIPLNELDSALQQIRTQAGLDKLEVIGLDACLMSHLEVLDAMVPHARYFIGSQETEPSLGWAYTSFLQTLVDNPDVTGADLGKAIVKSYISDDQRIVDEQARAVLMGRSSGGGGLAGLFGVPVQASAQQLAAQMGADITLTAVDLSKVSNLMSSVNNMVVMLQDANQKVVAQGRTYAQSFTSIWGQNVPPSYIDLGSFVQLLKQQAGSSATATQTLDRVLSDISQAVIAEKHGQRKPGASGVSIYFPNSQLYGTAEAGATSYTAIARRFVSESLWDDFMLFHYTGRRFQASTGTTAIPQRGVEITAPAAGKITLSPVQMSSTVAAPGKPITLTTEIAGENVGYVYIFAGYLDKKSNSIFIADTDYLQSSSTKQVQGVYYPVWPSDKFKLQFVWEPIVFAITDGKTNATTMLKPEQYGATGAQAVYSVDGIYTFASGGESRNARLYFADGVLIHAYAFTGEAGQAGSGAPREVIPQAGDTFTVLEQWLDIGSSGQPATSATQKGKTLTFSTNTLTWKEMDAAAGEYVVGFIVEDLDGNKYEVHGTVTVR